MIFSIKLQDFARDQGVTDRQVQRLLKKYAAELEGLYERKGPNGTWFCEEACEILRSKMKQQPLSFPSRDEADVRRIQELEEEVKALLDQNGKQADAMKAIAENNASLIGQINEFKRLEAENNKKIAEAEKEAQNAQKELTEAHESFEKELKDRNKEAWHHYRVALEIYNALPWWKKRRINAPVPPNDEE